MFLKKDEILFYGGTEIRIKIRRNKEKYQTRQKEIH